MLAIFGLCRGYVRQFMLKKTFQDNFLRFFPSRKAKTLKKKPTFFNLAKMNFSAAEGPKTL